jgi:hypothetical protein
MENENGQEKRKRIRKSFYKRKKGYLLVNEQRQEKYF